MRLSFVPIAFVLALVVPVLAQAPAQRGASRAAAGQPAANSPAAASTTPDGIAQPAPKDPKVFPADAVLPGPADPHELAKPTVELPDGPVEPYLLTRDAGPFMVLAHVFRGPDAPRYALALVLELRQQYQMPAWIFYQKVQPMHSNLRNIPPTAPDYVRQAEMSLPEKVRVYDEAAVLVGNCKTLDESEALWKKVKHIHPKCLENVPSIWPWRKGEGLSRAIRCPNPYLPAQVLYPHKTDPLIKQMNAGPMSLFNCPGRYTLQVAEFTGRSTLDPKDAKFGGLANLQQSPLRSAADKAQKLADALAKDPQVAKTGYRPYVYHDRFASKVTIGAFNSPDDPAAGGLRQRLLEMAVDLNNRKVTDTMIVPAPVLMDLQQLPPH